jgi:hypothetical protein
MQSLSSDCTDFRAGRVLLGACLAALLSFSSARAEMLQFSTPDGMKSWPKLETITDWHQDQEASLKLSANVIIPDGVDPATADMKIEARGFPRSGNSLSQMIDADRAANPGGTAQKQADLFDKDGTPFTIYAFAPAPGSSGSWKTVGYSEEGGTLLAFTLTARSKAAHDQGLPVFTETIHKYAREIPW